MHMSRLMKPKKKGRGAQCIAGLNIVQWFCITQKRDTIKKTNNRYTHRLHNHDFFTALNRPRNIIILVNLTLMGGK
jgi:hypothetical protein